MNKTNQLVYMQPDGEFISLQFKELHVTFLAEPVQVLEESRPALDNAGRKMAGYIVVDPEWPIPGEDFVGHAVMPATFTDKDGGTEEDAVMISGLQVAGSRQSQLGIDTICPFVGYIPEELFIALNELNK